VALRAHFTIRPRSFLGNALEPVTAYLVDAELLEVSQAEDRAAICGAIGKLLALLMAAERLRRDA
jgi:hypothetical protein